MRGQEHTRLVRAILAQLGALPDLRLWENKTGVARAIRGPDRLIAYGLKGSADILGILALEVPGPGPDDRQVLGRFLAIEVKIPPDTCSPQQLLWGQMVRSMGGAWIVARSVDDAVKGVADARAGRI